MQILATCLCFGLSLLWPVQNLVKSENIVGKWQGAYGNTTVTMIFNHDGTALSIFSSNGIKNSFRYHFLKPRIIAFTSGVKTQRYYIQKLTKSSFQFVKYPIKQDSEEISIIEAIDFKKK